MKPAFWSASFASAAPTALVLRGRRLLAARAIWLALAGLCVALLIVSLTARFAELAPAGGAPGHAQGIRPGGQGGITLPGGAYAGTILGAEVVAALGYFTVAAVIFWRRSNNWVVLYVSLMLAAFGAALPGTAYALVTNTPIWAVPASAVQALGWFLLLPFAYLFPDGRFVPRWTGVLTLLWAVWVAGFFLLAGALTRARPLLTAVAFVIWVGFLASGALAQLYRYRFVATPPQRQQTKWIVWGFALALVGAGAAVAPHILALAGMSGVLRGTSGSAVGATYQIAASIVFSLSALIIPITIAIAILRHHLYDIDLLINRTLVYGALTALLAVVYFVAVVALQSVSTVVLRSQTSTVAIVSSTLLIAALFQPLRQRVQIAIDRRFYRRKYDAARTLAAFSATLRHEIDLAQLRDALVHVVDRTMRPKHVSLWLAPGQPPTPSDSGANEPLHSS